MEIRRLTGEQARRLAVRAQLLDSSRPTDLVDLVDHLTLLQIDPTAAIAPSADLVAWSRLGSTYHPDQLRRALEEERSLFEHNAFIRPMSALGLMLADMATWPTRDRPRQWLEANDRFRMDILDRLEESGPLLSRDIPDTSVASWGSTGWTNNRNVTQMLEFMQMRGEVAISGRQGRQRIWDLADRVYPAGVEVIPAEEAMRLRDVRRLRALGIAREKTLEVPGEPYAVGSAGEPAEVEGVSGLWRVDAEATDRLLEEEFIGRTALLSPFDRLLHDRARAHDLFDFEYVLEMYKPKPQRRWGYFALPILHQDRLVGKLDAAADRKSGVLRVHAIHEDIPFTRQMHAGVRTEIVDLANWLGLEPDGI
jgi:uncharacterized protein